jgi:threonine/homoserine/homoserine lactone efflux protein
MTEIIIKGILLGLYLAIAVGPIVFTVLKVSMQDGHKAGYALVAGVSFSDIMFVVIGNLAAQFMHRLLVYETQIAFGGAILLLCIGGYTLFFKKDPNPADNYVDVNKDYELDPNPNPITNVLERHKIKFVVRADASHLFKMFTQGFLMNTINPGPIFIWLTACTASANLPLFERIIMFGITLGIVLTADILKVQLANRIREKLTAKTLHIINRVTAFILLGFGVAILLGLGFQRYEKNRKNHLKNGKPVITSPQTGTTSFYIFPTDRFMLTSS